MKKDLYDYGYGRVWKDVFVNRKKGYYTSVADFHEHDFFEINLILSGNVKILLSDCAVEGTGSRLVLTKPGTPHFVSCNPDTLYSRIYLVFSKDFVTGRIAEWQELSEIFGKNGRIINISDDQKDFCYKIINRIPDESNTFRKRLLVFYLLSYIGESLQKDGTNLTSIPNYIIEALSYIDEYYREKITAQKLAEKLHVCRTTLMTSFKKYTGSTLNDYIVHCRLKNAIKLLSEGKTEQETAEHCGLCDAGGLIRAFKREFGMTPKKYLSQDEKHLNHIS